MQALVLALESHANQDTGLNASLIVDLGDLHAVEAAPLIERAFDQGHVDLSVGGDWEEAQIRLGLLDKRLSPPTYSLLGDMLVPPSPDLPGTGPPPGCPAKAASSDSKETAQPT